MTSSTVSHLTPFRLLWHHLRRVHHGNWLFTVRSISERSSSTCDDRISNGKLRQELGLDSIKARRAIYKLTMYFRLRHPQSELSIFRVKVNSGTLHAEVATTSCQQSAYETNAGILYGTVGMQMIVLTISYVRLVQMIVLTISYVPLVAGLHVQAREPLEHRW